VFQITLGYSPTTGLLNTLTYPTSTSGVALNIQYGYRYGILQSVTDTTDTASTCGSTCVLWTANAMNGLGQVTQETLGNGVVTNRNYDGVTSWLTSVTAGVGGGAALLNQSYLQDEDGNVIQRQNNNLGLTENFAYDADNRLTCSTLGGSCSTPTVVYDGGAAGPGNITSQTGVGTYTYPAAGQPRPHAVTSIAGTFNGIANPAFSYDANGNMTDRASSAQNITWSSYNYPTAISASDATGNEQVQLFYGPDRQRWYQIYTNATTTEQTYYIGGLVDLVFSGGTTNYRHYIYAGNEPVAVYSRTTAGANTMSYMLEDHQGGVSAIASGAGTADVNESFSAFGTRRNPSTWSGAPTTTDLNTIASLSRQGYTFQTALGQSMGLNHMNGRVEDAILGRFLSPDPHIPDPSNAQSYNRYSYVLNNPLTRIDPTGFDDKSCPTAGGCSGGNDPGTIDPGPVDPGPLTTVNIPSPTPPTNTASAAGGMTTQSGGSAQSQDQGQGQLAASIPQASGPADYQIDTPVTVTSQSTAQNGPVLAQLFPGFTVGNAGVDPVMEALQQGRIPGAAEYAARAAQQGYSPNIGDPTLPPEPLPGPPTNSNPFTDQPFVIGLLRLIFRFFQPPVVVAPICTAPVCAA
jgi:RHS repeat-associated protein